MTALAAEEITESYARTLCGWTDRLPEDSRDTADAILAAAAARGMDLRDLAMLAAEIVSRACPPDEDPGPAFEDRAVRLETTFAGAGCCRGSDRGVRRAGEHGAGCPVRSPRRGG